MTTRSSRFIESSGEPTLSAPSSSIRVQIATALIKNAVPKDVIAKIDGGISLAVVAEVPSAEWVLPFEKAFDDLVDAKIETFAYDGSRKAHKPTENNDDVVDALRRMPVIGISQAPERYLPSTLLLVADHRVRFTLGDGKVLMGLLKTNTTPPIPKKASDDLLKGLSPFEIESAFRKGATGSEVAARLKAMKGSRLPTMIGTDVPLLRDLHGYGPAKTWADDLVGRVEDWKVGRLPWSRVAASCVLSGPPGVGKTLFGKSVARTLGLPLVATSVGQWFSSTDGHLGDVVKAITTAFEEARAASPCVLLIDEMDAIPSREKLSLRNRDWWTPVVTHLLTLLDGAVTDRTGVVVIGTTNHADQLDPALIRSGRLETLIEIGRPTTSDLAAIVRLRSGGDLRDVDDDELHALMETTVEATGADVVRWVREARALDNGRLTFDGLKSVVLPKETKTDRELEVTSVHEAGHAVVALAVGLGVNRVSIVSHADQGGHTEIVSKNGRCPSKDDVENVVVAMLAGRCAEHVVLDRVTAGASNDLASATTMIGTLHVSLGMGRSLVHRGMPDDVGSVLAIDPSLRADVEEHLRRLEARAVEIVRHNRGKIVEMASALRRHRLLTAVQIRTIFDKVENPNKPTIFQ